MNREDLSTLRDALDVILRLPDALRGQVAAWLAPEATKSNGHGNGVGLDLSTGAREPISPRAAPPPPRTAAKTSTRAQPARHVGPVDARTAERKLIAAMQASPGSSIAALANATEVSRSTMERRLQRLAAAGQIEKDRAGRWRAVEEEARPAMVEPHPPSPSL
jgi:DNA-binding transcriptional ArsR family regulator